MSVAIICGTLAYIVGKLHEQPPWLALCLAVFGPTGTVVALTVIYLRFCNNKIEKIHDLLAASHAKKGKP